MKKSLRVIALFVVFTIVSTMNIKALKGGVGSTYANSFDDLIVAQSAASFINKNSNDIMSNEDINLILGIITIDQPITSLEGVQHLTSLFSIDAVNGNLTSIPNGLASLSQLRDINASGNKITSLPSDFNSYPAMSQFNLERNALVDVPTSSYTRISAFTGPKSLQKQASTRNVGTTTNTTDISFTSLPIYNQVATYGDGSSISYALVAPDNSSKPITPTFADGKVIIDKANLTTNGNYSLVATINGGLLASSVYTDTFSVNTQVTATDFTITLNGAQTLALKVNQAYVEQGATATDNLGGNLVVTTTGSVDTTKPGTYTITYSAILNGVTKTQTRNITVSALSFSISLNGAQSISIKTNSTYNELGAIAVDENNVSVPVVITGNVDTTTAGQYIITYTATLNGISTSITRIVNVVKTDFTITLNGSNKTVIKVNEKYVE
ncbi:MAG: immunoglobulin-like domain-containing protein, partial [Bacilli bacterium]